MLIDSVGAYSLTERDPSLELQSPDAEAVVDSIDLIDGGRYDQLHVVGHGPCGEEIEVGLSRGDHGCVELWINDSEGTHFLVRPRLEPDDAFTVISSGGQETDQLVRWLPKRTRTGSLPGDMRARSRSTVGAL